MNGREKALWFRRIIVDVVSLEPVYASRIRFKERHRCGVVRDWVSHYNRVRPHLGLGPGIPDQGLAAPLRAHRHCFEEAKRVTCTAVLSGLHHEYELKRAAA